MRRAPIILTATAVGIAGTLGFKAQEPQTNTAASVSTTSSGTASESSGSTGSATSGGGSSGTSTSGSSSSTTEQASSSSTSKTVTSTASTQYGDVTLKVTFTNGKITAVENVALPQNDPHSSQISSSVGGTLQQSALSNADGTVDAVSGATYTSDGYAQALQSALDRAGLSTTTSGATS